MTNKKLSGPKISEPSEADIEATIERVEKKYDKVIHREDAVTLTKLYSELEWWFLVEKFSRAPKNVSIDSAKEIREYFHKNNGKDISLDEAQSYAKNALAKTILAEKERLAKEIKNIIENC